MRRSTAAMALCIGWLAGCGVEDGAAVDDSGDKADRVTDAADRGEIEIGTSRRARFTQPGQTHTFKLRLAAGSSVMLNAYPIASQEKTLKTTVELYGPVNEAGAVPREAIASTQDGTFPLSETLAAAGEYRIIVGTASRKMVGSYDLHALCSNLACHPEPVALAKREPTAELKRLAEAVECKSSGCSGQLHGYTYDAERVTAASLTEAVLKGLSQGDEDWSTLDALDADQLAAKLTEIEAGGLLSEARDFANARTVEGMAIDGLVQIPLGDFGTDGFSQDVYILHFPTTKTALALLVQH